MADIEAGNADGVVLALEALAEALKWPEAPEPSPHRVLEGVLRLCMLGNRVAARRLFAGFRSWLDATGSERRLMGGAVAVRLALVRGLVDLPLDLPEVPVRTMATGVHSGEILQAQLELRGFAAESPYSAGVMADGLSQHSRALAGLFEAALRLPEPTPAKKEGSAWKAWIFVVLALGILRGFSNCQSEPNRSWANRELPRYSPPSIPPITIPTFTMPRLDLPELKLSVPLSTHAEAICAQSLGERAAEICGSAWRAVRAARLHDCRGARRALASTRRLIAVMPSAKRPGLFDFEAALEQACAQPDVPPTQSSTPPSEEP